MASGKQSTSVPPPRLGLKGSDTSSPMISRGRSDWRLHVTVVILSKSVFRARPLDTGGQDKGLFF